MITDSYLLHICDLAETYQIYDYRQLPATRVAVFAYGLRNDSRIKMKLSGQSDALDTLLLAGVSDRLSTLIWFQSEDGQKGKNRPVSLVDLLLNKNKDDEIVSYDTGKDFEEARKKLLGGE